MYDDYISNGICINTQMEDSSTNIYSFYSLDIRLVETTEGAVYKGVDIKDDEEVIIKMTTK